MSKGYFAKELPPPFNTIHFSSKLDVILDEIKIDEIKKDKKAYNLTSECTKYSLPKVGYSRRIISIPNPYNQMLLCDAIVENWSDIEKLYSISQISKSKPIKDVEGSRAMIPQRKFGDFTSERLLRSYSSVFEVSTDISRFYPTVYTHIIPWVIHGKDRSKKNRKDTLYGNRLDRCLRNCNSGQTIGIPIGPDTSLIISEIIGCGIDKIISDRFKDYNIKVFRYYDDYYVYVDTLTQAEKVLKFLNKTLTDFQFDINESKTSITQLSYSFDSVWGVNLKSFNFRNSITGQRKDLEMYASMAIQYQREYPKDSVLKFATKSFKYLRVYPENWKYFESIILKFSLMEPVTLGDISELLITYKPFVKKAKVKSTVETIITTHIAKGHDYEVSWSLWLCFIFNIKLKDAIATDVFSSNDVLSKIIALHLRSIGLINDSVSIDDIKKEIISESLYNGNWLLAYEAVKNGWIKKRNFFEKGSLFDILNKNNISFYDEKRTIRTKTNPKEIKKKSVKKAITKKRLIKSKKSVTKQKKSIIDDY